MEHWSEIGGSKSEIKMTDESILEGALLYLPKYNSNRRWMTARGLATKMRRLDSKHFSALDQVRLTKVLLQHYDGLSPERRKIRASRLPSRKTLETLWGRVKPGERETGESPILRRADVETCSKLSPEIGCGSVESDEEVEEAPSLFLSYSHRDEADAGIIAARLDHLGDSTWISGERIHEGASINDEIRGALGECKKFAVFLTDNSATSKWVNKELFLSGNFYGIEKSYVIVKAQTEIELVVSAWARRECVEVPPELSSIDCDFWSLVKDIAASGRAFVYPSANSESSGTLDSFEKLPAR